MPSGSHPSPAENASQRAEESVIGTLLRSEEARTEIIGLGLDSEQFFYRPYRLAFEEVVERYYADESIDPLTVAEAIGPRVAEMWSIPEREAVDRVIKLATTVFAGDPAEHVRIIKRHSDLRDLLNVASNALHKAMYQESDPADIAAELSAQATRIVTGQLAHSVSYSYAELGSRWYRAQREAIEAKAQGVELGAYYKIKAVDDYAKGHRPGELFMLGGDAGVGKSALAWAMGRGFAGTQMIKEREKRIGTLVMSMEMSEEQSSSRFAQGEAHVAGDLLRAGELTRAELLVIARKWGARQELPIWVNHSGVLRETQLKAIIIDHIRRHNVGVVIIDHFRFIQTDEHFVNRNDADDQVVTFLKANLARDLNVAVVCLAHTRDIEVGRRPAMNDLRGSKMISAFADLVAFPYSPWRASTVHERDRGLVSREDFELIWAKVRQGAEGVGELYMDLSTQTVR